MQRQDANSATKLSLQEKEWTVDCPSEYRTVQVKQCTCIYSGMQEFPVYVNSEASGRWNDLQKTKGKAAPWKRMWTPGDLSSQITLTKGFEKALRKARCCKFQGFINTQTPLTLSQQSAAMGSSQPGMSKVQSWFRWNGSLQNIVKFYTSLLMMHWSESGVLKHGNI